EHLIAEGAMLVRHLLERVPTLTCLVTSRQHLNITGEQEFAVAPLATPTTRGGEVVGWWGGGEDQTPSHDLTTPPPHHPATLPPERLMACPSVQLFVDRARAVRPGFQIRAENAAAVAALCDRLEGLPLALELAAPWVRTLTPEQILQR